MRLVRLAVETGIVTSKSWPRGTQCLHHWLCTNNFRPSALLTAASLIIGSGFRSDAWWIPVLSLGKAYSNAMMVNFNHRIQISGGRTDTQTTALDASLSWSCSHKGQSNSGSGGSLTGLGYESDITSCSHPGCFCSRQACFVVSVPSIMMQRDDYGIVVFFFWCLPAGAVTYFSPVLHMLKTLFQKRRSANWHLLDPDSALSITIRGVVMAGPLCQARSLDHLGF